jgi:hypothetical protein
LAAVADFTADGSSDLLWLNDNGAADIWQISGSQVSSQFVPVPKADVVPT